ncbi:MAG: type I methionyl aminopeptidase [Dehalococcoidia bacterium]|nr:MAG: type I methionyl aminopeptidase [Dehalococcoidia bacterium]
MGIILKSPREIDQMREAGRIAATVLAKVAKSVRPGITTAELDDIAVEEVRRGGAEPSFKGYRGFPASICTSVNKEVVHGIPGSRVLNEGEIVSLDFGALYNGFHGDAAITLGVGQISPEAQGIIDAASGALNAGIAAAVIGARLGDVSAAIQQYAEARGFAVVREYVGHGIGRELHQDPQVPNFGVPGDGPELKRGMTLALEPMLNAGTWRTRVADDNWTVLTADGKLSAHFEHTIAIDEDGPKILTQL